MSSASWAAGSIFKARTDMSPPQACSTCTDPMLGKNAESLGVSAVDAELFGALPSPCGRGHPKPITQDSAGPLVFETNSPSWSRRCALDIAVDGMKAFASPWARLGAAG
mmetsp:Transcript_89051/g.247817  ORF Transcript_89051/g.247817 Transcript_89051/m.247817 type:complete len:109 (-) Transcript_89051:55-381(-)